MFSYIALMELQEILEQRHSVRRFTQEPLTDEQICAIEAAASLAPTSHNSHSCSVVHTTDKDKLFAISESRDAGLGFFKYAPCAFAVIGDEEKSNVWVEDASIAATYILLKAHDMGLGACWGQIRLRTKKGADAEAAIKDILGIQPDKRVLCVVAVGHKAPKPAEI